MRKEADDTGPRAELEHWRHRMAKFNSLLEQLKSKQCKTVIGILIVAKSKVLKVGILTTKGIIVLNKYCYLDNQGLMPLFFQTPMD